MPPPKDCPIELLPEFTLNGSIPIHNWWLNNSVAKRVVWNEPLLRDYMRRFTTENIRSGLHGHEPYAPASSYIVDALDMVGDISNKHIAVIGSVTPWIECICLSRNAASVTTIEYNPPRCVPLDRLSVISYDEFMRSDTKYDIIISYSSLEHSGLGRYGDPIDPNADLAAMKEVRRHLPAGGVCLLGVPVGPDYLVWNAHRIYGKIRLPMLIGSFLIARWIGHDKDLFHIISKDDKIFVHDDWINEPVPYCVQPLMVLYRL